MVCHSKPLGFKYLLTQWRFCVWVFINNITCVDRIISFASCHSRKSTSVKEQCVWILFQRTNSLASVRNVTYCFQWRPHATHVSQCHRGRSYLRILLIGFKIKRQTKPNTTKAYLDNKRKVVPVYAMKASRGSTDIAPVILTFGTRQR